MVGDLPHGSYLLYAIALGFKIRFSLYRYLGDLFDLKADLTLVLSVLTVSMVFGIF